MRESSTVQRVDDVDGGPLPLSAEAIPREPAPMTGSAAVMIHNARRNDHHHMPGANRAQKRAQWKAYKRTRTVQDVRVEIAEQAAKELAKLKGAE